MRTRILRPEEWQRLDGQDLSALLPYCEPQNISVVVVEDDAGEILAHVAVLRVTHFEGLWIKPEERGNAGVFRALIRGAYSAPRTWGERWALGGARNGDSLMQTLCYRLGGRSLPVEFFALPVGE